MAGLCLSRLGGRRSGGIGPRIGHDDAVLAVPLRFVKRFVGRGHELFGVFELALDRDAEARGHTYLGAVGKLDCRRLERGAQALGELPCADYVCLGRQQGELFAAVARRQVKLSRSMSSSASDSPTLSARRHSSASSSSKERRLARPVSASVAACEATRRKSPSVFRIGRANISATSTSRAKEPRAA